MIEIDVYPFQDFFMQMSRILKVDFEVRDGETTMFSSRGEGEEDPFEDALRDLSVRIMEESSFQHIRLGDGHVAFGVPVMHEEKTIAAIIAHASDPRCPLPLGEDSSVQEMATFLTILSGLMEEMWSSHKESEQMAEEISQYFEDLSLYGRISTQIRTLKFSGDMLKGLLEDLLDTMRVDLVFVNMPDRGEYNVLLSKKRFAGNTGSENVFIECLLHAIPEKEISPGIDYFIVNDSSKIPEYKALHDKPYRFLAVNIRHDSTLDGWLGLVSLNIKEIFRQSELRLLHTMAMQISVLLANLDLYKDLESFVVNMVKALVYAIEAKDTYTRGHSERVSHYCMLLADRLDLSDKEKDALHWASILHDIGKIGIPESILNKPGHLDDEEFGIIKGHPQKGSTILAPLIEQLSNSIPAIMHHHERYDGKGYPMGLKGERIPLFARIIAIGDTFDAVNSSRAYRPAQNHEKAMNIVAEIAGTQLDPGLVDIFKEIYDTSLRKEFEGK
ncbi:MAG: HD domain-containing phosphohydrolase [Pseudomonadota bacterium]